MTASPLTLKEMRAPERARPRPWLSPCLLALMLLAVPALGFTGSVAAAEPVKGEVRVYTDGGYARLVFRLDETVDAKVRQNGAILVIEFKKPVDVTVDRLNAGAPDYISAARRDPDGSAIRIALARKVKVNTIPAAERLYVDLLPVPWTGMLPGLPQEVVDELANRARRAESELHKQRPPAAKKEIPTIRVKVVKLPTFMRYVFDMPPTANVITESSDGKFKLRFDQQIKWDLADAKATLPSTLGAIDAETEFDSVAVIFTFNGMPETHSFREDRSIVVDVALDGDAAKPRADEGAAAKIAAAGPTIAPAETVPAKDAPAPSVKPAMASMKQSTELPPMKEPTKEAAHLPASPPPLIDAATPVAPATAARAPSAQAPAAAQVSAAHAMAAVEPPPSPKMAAAQPPPPTIAAAPSPPSMPAAKPDAAPREPVKSAVAAAPPRVPPSTLPSAAAPNDGAKSEAAAAAGAPPAPTPQTAVAAIVNSAGDNLRIEFPFAVPTPAAVFRRADTLWLVFDSAAKIDLAAVARNSGQAVRKATFTRGDDGEGIVRIRLARPQLASLKAEGPGWIVTIGDTVTAPTRALAIARSVTGKSRASIVVPFDNASNVHQIADADLGDRLIVVTALGPARGFLKSQDFVELHALPSTHGVVVQPIADDVTAALEHNKITISRPGGLSLSSAAVGQQQQQVAPSFRALTFDTQVWGFDRQTPFIARQSELIGLAAAAPPTKRRRARFNLARFYLAREMATEAIAVLDVALSDQRGGNDVTGSILKSIANIMLGRPNDALKELANPQIGDQQDAAVWRAIAHARQGKWPEAHAGFKNLDETIRALPIELQRVAMQEEMRSNIEVHDFTGATRIASEFETMGVPADLEPSIQVLSGRLFENLGRKEDALTSYRAAAASRDRRSASQGRLRELALLLSSGDLPHKEAINELETLTTIWRGDETETEGLKILAHLYTGDNRYRDAFHVMRTALLAHPNSDMTRKIQDEAATTFDSLFLSGKGDALPPVEALGLFYDFRELTPIGRRGDEMIRRLADRLVLVDLLDQAAELLQHQVDHRLHGAARAQVATRLAIVYLMNRKPDRALATLQKSRTSDLSNELRDKRLLLEARAMSDTGRHDLALEVIANIKGREAIRLRSDIMWTAKHWRDASEQIELMHGDRWRDFTPLNENERADILRAAIGYALADEQIGLSRLREKYAAKMADGPDRRAFDVVSAPIGTSGPEFQDIAKRIAAGNTLNGFLRDLRARYPDETAGADGPAANNAPAPVVPPSMAPAKPVGPTSKAESPEKAAMGAPPAGASPLPPKVPSGVPLKPDPSPTGSIRARLPRAQAR